jgi:hypothetical protein
MDSSQTRQSRVPVPVTLLSAVIVGSECRQI